MIDQECPRQTQGIKFALVILCIFIAGCYLSPTLSFSKTITILVSLISFLYFFSQRQDFYPLLIEEKVLILFLFLTVLSCTWGDKASFIYSLKSSLVILFFILFIANFREEIYKNINVILMTVVLSSALLASILLYYHFSIHGFNLRIRVHEFYGPIVQTIKTASVFTIALLVIIWNIFRYNGWQRWVSVISFSPVLLAMLALQSRGAVLAIGVGVSVLYIVHNRNTTNFFRQSLIGIILLGVIVSMGMLFSLEFNPKGIAESRRIPIWLQSIYEVYPENFLWGLGYSKNQQVMLPDGSIFTHSHNIFVSVFRITGLIGLLSFSFYLFSAVKRSITEKNPISETSLFLAWLATALCTYFFDGRYPVYIAPDIFLILWLPLAFLSAPIEGKNKFKF